MKKDFFHQVELFNEKTLKTKRISRGTIPFSSFPSSPHEFDSEQFSLYHYNAWLRSRSKYTTYAHYAAVGENTFRLPKKYKITPGENANPPKPRDKACKKEHVFKTKPS